MFKYFEKINGNYLSFACLSNKISFLSYSIFNLLFAEPQLSAIRLQDVSLSNISEKQTFVKRFIKVFQNFFEIFQNLL